MSIQIELAKNGPARVYRRTLRSVRSDWTEEELQELKRTQENTEQETGLHNEHGCRLRPTKTSRQLDRGVYDDQEEVMLLDVLHAHPDSKIRVCSVWWPATVL